MTLFHEGERLVQERAGESQIAARVGRGISRVVPEGAREFLAGQRTIAAGHVDGAGDTWASLLIGQPGLASTVDGSTVVLDWTDPPALRAGAPIGLLAIELETARRLRINGRIARVAGGRIEIAVRESYGNCPKYIQRRCVVALDGAGAPAIEGRGLDGPRRELIERADTAFVASRHPSHGADVSHRGGNPGFLRVLDAATIRVPDYRGNGLFNTLGNLVVEPRAGLAVVDFERGRVLQLTGRAALRFDLADDAAQPSGTGRYWDLHVSRWIERPLAARMVDPCPPR